MSELFVEVNLVPKQQELAMHATQVWLHAATAIGSTNAGTPQIISFLVKNSEGSIIAGLLARLQMKILYIESAWVLPDYKKKGAGAELKKHVLDLAKENSCQYLIAASYDFFDAISYFKHTDPEVEVFAEIPNCPFPHTLFYFKKKLN